MMSHNNKKLFLYLFLILLIIFLLLFNYYKKTIIDHDDAHNNHHKYTLILESIHWNNRMINRLCDFNRNSLKYYIWSHRSYLKKDLVDGSEYVLDQLLSHNIRNFDIDVSCILINNGRHCKYVVAHPSRINIENNNIHRSKNETQTIHRFLWQIYEYLISTNELSKHRLDLNMNPRYQILTMPIITIEMKFNNIRHQIELIKSLQDSPMAKHIAFITTNPSMITSWYHLNHTSDGVIIKLSGIVIAYRSLPLTKYDYQWPVISTDSNNNSSSSINTYLKQQYLESQPYNKNNSRLHIKDEVSYQYIPTIKLPRSKNYKYWQIHMPDKKLLPLNHHLIDLKRNTGTNHQYLSMNKLVISWVIDTPQDLFDSFLTGVDGIISNNPIQLLSLLTFAYDKICINYTLRVH